MSPTSAALRVARFIALLQLIMFAAHGHAATPAPLLGDEVEAHANPKPPVLASMPSMPRATASGRSISNLTVFVLPHSHDDLGWQRTVDEYYEEEVRYIYDGVVDQLLRDPSRRFLFVETGYFMRWWHEQSASVQSSVRTLITEGRIDFSNGAWCMADDASPGHVDQIQNAELGLRYVRDTVGAQVRTAWHIDPFGLSASYASLFGAMNYTSWVFNRVDTRLKDLWHNDTHLQFHWRPRGAPPSSPGIFAHVLDTHYGAPEINYKGQSYHFDYEVFGGLGGGENAGSQLPVSDTAPSPFYNATVDSIAEAFAAIARLRAGWYRLGAPYQHVPDGHGVILVPFGDDMKFQNAAKQYGNMDRLIRAVNTRFDDWGVNVRYGTLREYFALINTDLGNENKKSFTNGAFTGHGNGVITSSSRKSSNHGHKSQSSAAAWPVFEGDFMPLGTNENVYTSQIDWNISKANEETEYWTGHYTTRPLMKQLVSRAGGARRTSEIALSLACAKNREPHAGAGPVVDPVALCNSSGAPPADLLMVRKVTAAVQHHDSITGTSVPRVTADLDTRLRASAAASGRILRGATAAMLGAQRLKGTTDNNISHDRGSAIARRLIVSSGTNFSLFNGMLKPRTEVVTLFLSDGYNGTQDLVVFDASSGQQLPSVLIPPVPGTFAAKDADSLRSSIVFRVVLAPLRASVFTVAPLGTELHSAAKGSNTSATTASSNDAPYKGTTDRVASLAHWHCGEEAATSSVILESTLLRVTFDPKVRRMRNVTVRGASANCSRGAGLAVKGDCAAGGDTTISVQQQFFQYHSSKGSNAYQFAPDRKRFPFGEPLFGLPTLCTLKDGGFVARAVQTYTGLNVVREVVSVYEGLPYPTIETRTELTMAQKNRELVTRYVTSIDNTVKTKPAHRIMAFANSSSSTLPAIETDSNGYLMMHRVTNQTQWAENAQAYRVTMPVAGNYYPLSGTPGAARISGPNGGLTVLTDTAHGAASLQPGWLEVMLGRRCAEIGGAITVDDTDFYTATNWLLPAADRAGTAEAHRMWAQQIAVPLLPVIIGGGASFAAEETPITIDQVSSLSRGTAPSTIPPQVQLLSLSRAGLDTSPRHNGAQAVLRLQHVFQVNETDSALGKSASFSLEALFAEAGVTVVTAEEVPLSGLAPLDNSSRRPIKPSAIITLTPLQIRTFLVVLG